MIPLISLKSLFLLLTLWVSTQVTPAASGKCPKMCLCHGTTAFCGGMKLTHLPRTFPPETQTVYMQDNYMRRMKYSRLQHWPPTIRHILMKGNRISRIDQGTFRDMPHLVALSLTQNKLRYINPKAFKGLTGLKVLSLRNNSIRSVEKLFAHMHNLQLLNLGGNSIRRITEETFAYNWRLHVLDLRSNNIHHVARYSFRTLPFLKYLVLSGNPLKDIHLDFRQNLHLELLDLSNCTLKRIPRGMPHSVDDLRLNSNLISSVRDTDFKTTRKVRLLVLNDNKIRFIHPKATGRLWQLYDLYIGKNKLSVLPTNLPRSTHAIYANYNNIRNIIGSKFRKNNKLRFMYLSHNSIMSIDTHALDNLVELRGLVLSWNNLRDVKAMTFDKASHLEVLDLSYNPIYELDSNSFKGLTSLHILQLSSLATPHTLSPHPPPIEEGRGSHPNETIRYTTIKDSYDSLFQDMGRLMYLDLNNSSMIVSHVTHDLDILHHLDSVQDLNMMNDQLVYLPPNFPNYFPHLRVIKLAGNPWHCDMSISWLALWMQNGTIEFFAPEHMVCHSPEKMKGHSIMMLLEEQTTVEDDEGTTKGEATTVPSSIEITTVAEEVATELTTKQMTTIATDTTQPQQTTITTHQQTAAVSTQQPSEVIEPPGGIGVRVKIYDRRHLPALLAYPGDAPQEPPSPKNPLGGNVEDNGHDTHGVSKKVEKHAGGRPMKTRTSNEVLLTPRWKPVTSEDSPDRQTRPVLEEKPQPRGNALLYKAGGPGIAGSARNNHHRHRHHKHMARASISERLSPMDWIHNARDTGHRDRGHTLLGLPQDIDGLPQPKGPWVQHGRPRDRYGNHHTRDSNDTPKLPVALEEEYNTQSDRQMYNDSSGKSTKN